MATMTGLKESLASLAVGLFLSGLALAQGPSAEIRARIDAFVAAITSGDPARFEAMAREAFTPEMLARRTADDRRQMIERLKADFGTMTAGAVRHEGDAVLVQVKGSTGLAGRFEVTLEPAPPYRITRMGVEVGGGPDEDEGGPPPPVRPGMSPAEFTAALDGYFAPLVPVDRFAGVVLIAKNGVALVERAYGLADRPRGVEVTPATRFNLGSINKIFTKVAIAQLAAAGKLALTDTVGQLLPDHPSVEGRAATVQQLLDHQGGVRDFFGPDFDAAPKTRFRSNADYYRFVAAAPLLFPPGSRRQYCNGCYIVLGAIVEKVSGMRYEDYVVANVFRKAGMTGAGAFASDALPEAVARGYSTRGPGRPAALRDNAELHGITGSAAGGGYATAADLLAFDNALREGRLLDAKQSAWVLDTTPAPGRLMGGLGIAGGAPGINASLESDGTWTTVVLSNLDPPSATRQGIAIFKQLTR
jgi:CubicO group peptidase (beta-lactamase class C family)